jgi:hypothetical protein
MIIASRFRGPPTSANGGYACGLVAAHIDGPAEVKLRSPPPLERELTVAREGERVLVRDGAQLVAEGAPTAVTVEPPATVDLTTAADAATRYPWQHSHPFPSCFVCGPERAAGDGLRILPGLVDGRRLAAAPFVVDGSNTGADGRVPPEVMWAALDCPSWFGFFCTESWAPRPVLLGSLAARVDSRPRAGETCVAIGWFIGRDGRKINVGSAIYAVSGELHAVARATWIELK